MIILYTSDTIQVDLLQWALDQQNIKYETKESIDDITYLEVNGVPLDFPRAMKWIESRGK